MRTEKTIALFHAYQKALDAYLRAQKASHMDKRSPAKIQRVEDARILLEVAKREYFEACAVGAPEA
jgi:hypothetical protein